MLIQKEEELEKLKGRSPSLRKANSFDLDSTQDSGSKKEVIGNEKDKTKEGLNYDYLKNIIIKYLVY